jgi:GDP-4-dehydro-6-deoxy-D-mannose reductase
MRVVITGAQGFVGPHAADALAFALKGSAEIITTSMAGGEHPRLGRVLPLDVTDEAAIVKFITDVRPTHVLNLAGIASVAAASAGPDLAWRVNFNGPLHLARVILRECPECWLLNVGSGLAYGESAKTGRPLDENTLLDPMDEYAASKAAVDMALGALVRRGLRCIRLRPFNHMGTGQSEDFVATSFAMQIARIEAGLSTAAIRIGNLEAERDFLDVRDVANAYAKIFLASDRLPSGLILNIASGIPRRISEILDVLRSLSRVTMTVEQDHGRMRPSDLPTIIGDASKARELLGWAPRYDFKQTLNDILDDCRRRAHAYQDTAPADQRVR